MQTCTEASLYINQKDPPEKVGLSFVDVVCFEKKKSTSFRMCFYLAEQEGFGTVPRCGTYGVVAIQLAANNCPPDDCI